MKVGDRVRVRATGAEGTVEEVGADLFGGPFAYVRLGRRTVEFFRTEQLEVV